MSTLTIDQMVYTLCELGLYCRCGPPRRVPTSAAISRDNQRRLRMLSLLSLLIVTEGSGDVAAVSLHATAGKGIELCYSKNHPCTPDETAYVIELFETATNSTSSSYTKITALFNLVLCKCKDKIIARLHKLCNRLRDLAKQDDVSFATSNPRARVDGNPVATQCDAKIRKFVGTERFPLECSLADFLKSWFQLLLSSLQHDPCFDLPANKSLLRDTITISYLLAQEPQAASILDWILLHRIRKLGEYHAAITVLVNEITKLNSDQERGISIKEIVPPPPDTQFSGDFLAILHQCARDNGTTEVTEKYLSKEYHGKRELPSAPKVGLKASVHCECSLALAFAKSRLNSPVPTILVIGISKYTCRLCREFLATFHDSYPHITIHVPACSSKLRSGWTLPPGAPSKVVNAMRRRLQDVITQVLTESVRTPAADSDACADDSSSDEFGIDDSDEDFHDYFNDDSDDDEFGDLAQARNHKHDRENKRAIRCPFILRKIGSIFSNEFVFCLSIFPSYQGISSAVRIAGTFKGSDLRGAAGASGVSVVAIMIVGAVLFWVGRV